MSVGKSMYFSISFFPDSFLSTYSPPGHNRGLLNIEIILYVSGSSSAKVPL